MKTYFHEPLQLFLFGIYISVSLSKWGYLHRDLLQFLGMFRLQNILKLERNLSLILTFDELSQLSMLFNIKRSGSHQIDIKLWKIYVILWQHVV